MAPVRSLLGGRFRTATRGVLALLCLVPQGGLALAAAPPAHGPQGLPREQRAQVACTPTGSFTNCARVTYSGGDQTFTVPAGVTAVYARVFGAGGAGSPRDYYTGQYGGGGGGYTTGTLAVTPGQALTLTVGQGGRLNSTTSSYGGGGAGGQGFTAANGSSATGGSGGGMSAVWNGASGSNPLVVAGGGGGSSPGADATTPAAGSGGGSNGGQDNQPAASGRGGTQSAGGAAATQTVCAAAGAGSQYQGGRGAPSPQNEGGGGGGGGYFGGGGGACQRGGTLDANGMGGGGSGYNRGTGVTNTQTSNGTNSNGNGVGGTSGGRGDAQYTGGSGIGDGGGYSDGGNGEIVLEWVTQVGLSVKKTASPTTYVPGQRLTYTFVVSNAGPAPAVNAAVRDALPSALGGFTWTCASGGTGSSCGAASGTGNLDTTATIAANSSVTYTVTGTVPSSTTGTLSNTATVTRPAASTDPNCGPTCSSTVDTPGRPTTGLSVTKTPDKNPYVPGQPLTYTIVVKNDGPSDAAGTSVRDTLPTTIRNFTWTCTATGGGSCGTPASGTGDINTTVNLPAGAQVTYRLTGTVPADATGSLDNRATVTPPGGATDPNCSPDCTSTANPVPPANQANLIVSKTLLTNPVVPGQQVRWQVKVTNNGPSRARNVVVTDQVPSGVTAASMANDQDGTACPITGGTASCPAVEIAVNGTASWTLTGTLDPNATATPTNTALVTGGPDPSAATRTAVASPTASPSPQADLTISKTLLTNPVVPGAQIQWRVTVTNNGPSRARNVVVTDQVPAGVTGASMRQGVDGANCPVSGGVATCPAVEIPAGSSQTWTLTGTLDPNATVTPTNTAVVTGGPDPGATARTAVASPTAIPSPQANLTVSKSLLTSPVVPGQPVQWRVTVTNNGPSRARNVVVTDQIPAGISGATMTADTGGANCPVSGGIATCPAVEIPAGSSLSWTLTGTLDANATVTPVNSVTVTGGPDPSASSRTAVASPTASPSPQANLNVSKSLVTNPVVPGQRIEWRVTVTNNGPSRARNVVVTDRVPAGVNNPVMTASDGTGCPISGGVATCPAVEIPAGQALNWTLSGTLDPNATATPTNTVTVTGGPDPTASTHTAVASPTADPSPQANLTASKVLLTNPVVPGQQIQWRVTVTNNGPSRARDVVVRDQIPAGISGATMTADTGGANCPISGGIATCPAVEIAAGSSLTWTLTGTLDANTTTTPANTVTVTGGPDPATPTHTAVASPSGSPSPQANLTVSKALLTDPVVPGRQIQWRVTVTNNGPSRARNVIVTDQVPAGVNNPVMTASDGTGCPISGSVATCPAVEIPAGSSQTWTLTGTLASDATSTPVNSVTVTGGPDPSASTRTAVASPTNSPSPQANLTVSKVLLTNPVVPGQQIQWRVTVTNNGPSRARNVIVTDTVPAGVTGTTMTADTGGANCPISGGIATCPAVEIPAGSSQSWTLTGTLAQDATLTPTNTATVTGGPDPATPTHTAVASPSGSPSPQANLTVSKVLLTNPVVPGQQIQWRVTVTNNGPSRARNVIVTDQVPAGVGNASMAAADGTPCPITGGTATCPALEIPAGSSATWTLTATLDANATITPTNTVTVTGGPDPATPTHTAVATPTNSAAPQANLTTSKILLTNPVVPGQQIQWRVTVTNNGPSRARDVVVTDTVPAGVTGANMKADADDTPCPINSGTATCPAVDIPVGQTTTWTLSGTLAPDATVTPTNTVVITGGPDPATPTHTAVASPTNSPTPQANLTVSKALLTNPVVPGQQIQWRVSITNNGPSRARNVIVTDQVPAGINNASMKADTDGTNCPITGGSATCPAVEIPAGSTMTWTLTGTLAQDATVTPTNTVTVTGGPDPATPTHTAVATPTNTPLPQANLTVSKALLTNPVVPGRQIQWQVNVTNNGPSRARDVVVTDTVPAGVTGANMKADADNTPCPINGGTATCPAVEIPAGQTLTWTLTGTLAPDATATPANTAVVTGGPDPATPTHTAVASPTDSPTPQANLTVSKTLLTNPVVPGQQIQWQLTVTNNGPSRARGVVVTDTIPAGVTNPAMAAADGTNCPISGGTATCPAVEIPAGSTMTWTLTGTLDANTTVTPTNTATVTGGPDPATPTHTAVATPTNSPAPQANLTVSKTLLTNPVVPGQQIQWQLTVTNNGPSRARGVVVTDTIPADVTNPAMAAADGTNCPISGGTATCPAVEIPAGSTMTWTLTGTLDANATVTPTNTATVTGGPDPSVSTHTAVASPTNSATPQANLVVSKTLLTNPVVPGQQIQWQLTVTNNGPSRARDVVVTDTIPVGVTNPAMTAADGTACPITDGTVTCPATDIAVGQTLTWTLTGTLAQDATVTPTNTATVTGGPDPATPTHTAVASPSNSPAPQANLTVSKVLLTNPVVPGQQIQWQLTVTNNGPSRARDVVVTDTIPVGVTNPAMTAADGTTCPINGGTATCPAVEIPVGQTVTWTLTGTLAQDVTVTPTNTATVTGGPDPTASTHTAVASPSSAPSAQANLTVSKALLTNPVVPGQQIQWQVTVTNNGPSRARDVVVTDTVPTGVTGASMKADADNTPCPISNRTATCPAVEIPVGQTVTWTLTGTLDANATVTPTNTATVTGGPDPATPTHTAVATPTNSPAPQANLTVSKVLLTKPVVPGQQIQWRVTVTNNGPSRARNVVVTDRVPDGVGGPSMTAANGSVCPITDGTAVCPAIELEVGQTVSYTLSGTLMQDATVTPTNTATVTGGPDPATPTHTAVASPTAVPTPQANLTVAKALLTDPVVPGEVVQWRVTVTNNGPSKARNVVVTDRIPDGVSNAVLQSDADASACPIADGTAVCPAIELEVGQTVSYTLTATLAPDAAVTPTNTATVTGGPDPATPTHTAVASPTAVPTPQANLSIAKALLTNPVVPGQRIEWRVTVTNNGPSRARNVVVTDQVPSGVDNPAMTADDGTGCPIAGGTATCPAVEIPAGGSVSYTVGGTLDPAATGTPVNVAVVTGGPGPTATAHTATAQASETVEPRANLTVSKALLTDPVVPGESIAWRISVTNNGPSLARDVVVSDRIPEGVVGASLSPDATQAACPVTGGTAVCPPVEIPVGGTVTYTLSGVLAQDATVTPTNTVTVTGGPDPSTPTHTAVASPTGSPSPQAKLTVSKVLVTDPVVPGGTVQWRVTVVNNGPSRARNIVVTDRVPDGVSGASMVSDEDGTACPVANGTATCPAIDLEVGETASYTLSGTLAQDATVTPTNTVTVTGGPDPATPTHTAVASPTESPEPQANLVVAKILVTDPVVPGQQIQWRVTVTNNGPSRARNVVVADRVPAGVDGATMAAGDGTACPISNGLATCPAVEIEVGETLVWTLTGTLQAGATVTPTNTVTVTGGPDPATPTHTAVASPSGEPVQEARLAVSKALLTDPVVPGQRIQWQVSVTNRGPSVARDVVVTDRVPAGVNGASMAADDGTACAITGGTAVCPAVGIPVGATRTWTLTGTLDAAATVTPTNTVTVTGGPDPATPTHTAVASPSGEPVQRAHLTVAKALVTNPVVPGAPVEWRVTVTNDGPSLARGVVVTDRIPAGVLDASMAAQDGTACPITGGTATCPAVEIPVGRTLAWTVQGTLDPAATVTPTNTATVTGGPDPATPTHTAVASPSESPSAQARLSVAKVLLTDPVVAGQRIQWRVTVTNHGPSRARNVVVTDRVPAEVNGASMTADDGSACTIADGTATCPAVGIPVGGTAGWTLTGTLDADVTAVPVNSVVVTGGPDPDATDRTAVATPTVPITVRHDLLLTKRATPTEPKAGDRVTYTVTATNRASGTYFGAVVTDDLSGVLDGAVYGLDALADTGRTAYAAPRLTWTLDLRPGATATLSYTVTVKPGAGGATLVNRLSADGSNCSGSGTGARRAAAVSTSGNCSTTTTVRRLPSPSPSPTTRPPLPSPSPTVRPPLPPTGSGSPKPALLVTVLLLALGGLLVAARRSRR